VARGAAAANQGRLADAAADCRRALELNPGHENAKKYLAAVVARLPAEPLAAAAAGAALPSRAAGDAAPAERAERGADGAAASLSSSSSGSSSSSSGDEGGGPPMPGAVPGGKPTADEIARALELLRRVKKDGKREKEKKRKKEKRKHKKSRHKGRKRRRRDSD
jgi:hypothetical protein